MLKFKNVFVVILLLLFVTNLTAGIVAKLRFYKGRVLVKKSAASKSWSKPRLKMKLSENYVIKTSKNSEVRLVLKGGKRYIVGANKVVTIKDIIAMAKKADKGTALAKLRLLKNKFGKGGTSSGVVTAVAGVRGADVSKKSKFPVKPSELIWEE